MKKALNSMAILVLLGMSSSAFADCYLDKATSGWTGSLQFHCDSATDLEANPITFDVSNNIKVSSIWGLPGNAVYTQDGRKISITVKKWWPDEAYVLPANSQATLQFSPSSNDFQISNFHVGALTPQSKATIVVKLPTKPDYITDDKLADILIYSDNTKVYEINNAQWGQDVLVPVTFSGESASYSVTVPELAGGQGSATPASFTLVNGGAQPVTISYEAPKPDLRGNISITASTPGAFDHQPGFRLKNGDGLVVKEGNIRFDSAIELKDLPTSAEGEDYYLNVESYVDNGFIYKPNDIAPIMVKDGQTTQVAVSYTKEALPSEQVDVTVTGLPEGKHTSLTLKNSEDDEISQTLDANKDYQLEIPQDGLVWTVTSSSIDGYKAVVSPVSFTANADTQTITINYKQHVISEDKFVTGYWENWKGALQPPAGVSNQDAAYYSNDVKPYTHVLYSFLTLAKTPNPDNPSNSYWDGSAIYESMTANNVLTVMQHYPAGTPDWKRVDNWQRAKMDALIQAVHNNNAKFIWAIGGWSDIQKTLKPDQVDNFVDQVVDLLKLAGDGVDFDWEHLSANADITTQQRDTLAEVMLKLRQKLDAEGMSDKQIGYTTRWNAFMNNASDYGFDNFSSDGEGITINNWLKAHGSSLNDVVSWVNVMAYDMPASQMPNDETWTLPVYKDVFDTFSKYVDKDKIVMGFEPGGQAAGGQWEGLDVDKSVIDYIAENDFGGSMFWAINQPAYNSSEVTGLNADTLANYSQQQFDDESQA
ncbi:MAG: hypothetical protein ACO2ZM_09820 [Francisellaceae bacterium]